MNCKCNVIEDKILKIGQSQTFTLAKDSYSKTKKTIAVGIPSNNISIRFTPVSKNTATLSMVTFDVTLKIT